MMLNPVGVKVHPAPGYTDLRKGIDGLGVLVERVLAVFQVRVSPQNQHPNSRITSPAVIIPAATGFRARRSAALLLSWGLPSQPRPPKRLGHRLAAGELSRSLEPMLPTSMRPVLSNTWADVTSVVMSA